MHNNYHFFLHLSQVLKSKLLGLKLMDCFSQEKDEMVLGFAAARGKNTNYKQYFVRCSVLPLFSGFYFTKDYRRAKKNSINLWDKYYDLAVLDVFTYTHERALGIQLENNICICFKMFGNRSNILIFDKEHVVAIFNSSLKADKAILQSTLHKPEPPSIQEFEGNVKKSYPTLGKVPMAYLASRNFQGSSLSAQKEILRNLFSELEDNHFYLTLINGITHLSLVKVGDSIRSFDDSIEVSNKYFIHGQKFLGLEKEKNELLKNIQRRIKSIKTYLVKAQKRLEELSLTTKNQEIGHIIMANLHAIPERATEVFLHDFINNKEVKIKLKEDLKPQENAQNYYRKAKNEQLEVKYLEDNLKRKQKLLDQLEKEKEAVNALEDLKKVRKLKALLLNQKSEIRNSNLFKTFEFDGWQIWIGKNAKNNELLTLKYTKKNDLWLHVRDVPGSHTVIKDKPGNAVPNHVLEYAAGLAAYFSKRRTESLVPVMYTPKKYVRKMKGTPDGQVIVEKEQVIMVPPVEP